MKKAPWLLSFIIIMTSCNHYYYVPNTTNVPLHQKKGVIKVAGSKSKYEGEIQASVSLTRNIAVMYNGYHAADQWRMGGWNVLFGTPDEYDEYSRGRFSEGGLGYYKRIGKNFVYELYTGWGKGSVSNLYEFGQSEFRVKRWFFQPDIGFSNDFIEAAISCRLSGLSLQQKQITGYFDDSETNTQDMIYTMNHPRSFLAEPAVTLKAGYRFVKFQGQAGWSYNITSPQLKQIKSYIRFSMLFSFHKDNFRKTK